jgi:hypothetical protein
MQSKRATRFNGGRSDVAELKMRNHKLEEVEKNYKASHGKTARFAVQRSLCLNLVRAGLVSGRPAPSGALRTPAPPRPRRLHHFPADFFHAFVSGNKQQVVKA